MVAPAEASLAEPLALFSIDTGRGFEQLEIEAELLGNLGEGGDVFPETIPTVSDAGIEERPTDAAIQAHALGDLRDIRADPFANLRHRVDKRNLHRQERIRGVLDQLRAFHVGHHDGGVQGLVQGQQQVLGPLAFHPDDDPIRMEEILQGLPLTQELRV